MKSSLLSVLLSFTSLAGAAAPRLVPDGLLGQSGARKSPVAWTSCRYCVSDGAGNVYFPDGWWIRKGAAVPERMGGAPAGELLSDGKHVYSWRPELGVLSRLSPAGGTLAETGSEWKIGDWRQRPFLAPDSCRTAFASRARVLALDMKARVVRAWDESGRPLGTVFDYSARLPRPDLVRAAALHPKTGELLLGTYWPECRVHRFREDGREVTDEAWPFAVMANFFACSGERMFALGSYAQELVDTFGGEIGFGQDCNEVRGLARGDGGWWLATTQGAQFYPDGGAVRGKAASRRIGGIAGVTALGLSGGRVLAAAGYRVYGLWLDDRRDEPFSGDIGWCAHGKWDGAIVSVEARGEGTFALAWRSGADEAAWHFDPRLTEWKDRARRVRAATAAEAPRRPANEDRIRGYRVVAEEKEIVLYSGKKRVSSYPVVATAIAAEGDWLVAGVPELKAILRLKLKGV